MMTRSMGKKVIRGLELDSVSTLLFRLENSECYDEIATMQWKFLKENRIHQKLRKLRQKIYNI